MGSLMLAVEKPAAGVVVVRVNGELNRVTAARLGQVLDDQLDRLLAAHYPPTTIDHRAHLIVDLAGVRHFTDGLAVLRHTQDNAALADVEMHLSGLTARVGLLPAWAAPMLAHFDRYPTPEDALTAILNATSRPMASR